MSMRTRKPSELSFLPVEPPSPPTLLPPSPPFSPPCSALICQVDNVSSKQMAEIRRDLRGRAVLLMGKNTLVKKCVRSYVEKTGDDKWEYLLDLLVLNVGILFVENDLNDVRSAVLANTVPAPARVGATATVDVTIPAGNTGMDPAQTSFFQALNIPTKITKGNVEIIKDVELLKVGIQLQSLLRRDRDRSIVDMVGIGGIYLRGGGYLFSPRGFSSTLPLVDRRPTHLT